MRAFRLFFLGLVLAVLAACGGQPEADQLRSDVDQQLAQVYGQDAFEIVELNRLGSAVDSSAPAGETRRVVYYDIELKARKDIELGGWDQPSVASMVTVLGAGPQSITGVLSGGNRAGDIFQAHASAIYRQDDQGRWQLVAPAGVTPSRAPSFETGAPPPVAQRLLKTLDDITSSVARDGSSTAQRIVQQELQRSVARINGRLTRMQQGYPFAAGADGGEYLAFARALAAVDRNDPFRLVPLVTSGGRENIDLLRQGDAVLAIAQADTARMAYEGQGPFTAQGAFPALRALGSLYPELVHIIVPAESDIESVGQLRGKRIALGPEGSAVRTTLLAVLQAHGLEAGDGYQVDDAPFADALLRLRRGEVDAVVHVIGVPSTALRDAYSRAPFRVLPLDPAAVERLTAPGSVLLGLSMAAGSYPGQAVAVPTVGMAALLLSTTELTRGEAVGVVDAVYRHGRDILARGSAQAAQVSVANARRGVSVPVHDGAEEALVALEKEP